MFWSMYTLSSDQIRVISIAITLKFHYVFMMSAFQFLSSNYVEVWHVLLLSILT
jgi:hypothetical protein